MRIKRRWLLLTALLMAVVSSIYATEMECEADGSCEEVDSENQDDFIDPCRNTEEDGNCPGWAASGECKKNPSYMHSACAKSCGVCTKEFGEDWHLAIPATITCQDLHEMCPAWAKQGECVINPTYMTSACKKSCMLCIHIFEEKHDEEKIRRTKSFMSLDLGPHQRLSLGKTDAEQNKIKSLLKKMEKYAKTNLTEVEDEDIRQRCRNELGECAYWAAMGHCLKRPGFMIATCPLACLSCDKTSQFHRCTGSRNPKLQPAAFDGASESEDNASRTMNAMFSKIHQQEGEAVDTLVAPTEKKPNDPWILRWDSFLTEAQIQGLLELANTGGEDSWRPSVLFEEENSSGNPTGKPPRRVSTSRFCDGKDLDCEANATYRQVLERISTLTGIAISNFETTSEFTRYAQTGDSYGVHHDYLVHDTWKPSGPRILTFLLCLSQPTAAGADAGGGLGFPHMEWLVIKPKQGQAVLWPNVGNDDVTAKDNRLVNEILPLVQNEEPLVTLTVWIHLYDYASHVERDCV